jgi:S-methylmethionine-dependent homocysteine/selenocysteine methylase
MYGRTFAEQAKALADGGVDLLLIETMFSFEETTAAFEGAKSVTNLPIVVSFSYDRGTRSMMGVKPKDVMKLYTEMGATLVGANCGSTLENMELVVKEYAATGAELPIVGEAQCRSSRTWILRPSRACMIWVPKIWQSFRRDILNWARKSLADAVETPLSISPRS